MKPYDIRTTIISPGAVATELANTITDPDIAEHQNFYEDFAIPADSFARMVAFAISQPDDVDVNEILFRPTRRRSRECGPCARPGPILTQRNLAASRD